jgi:small subunit ribosomal protein S18
MPVPPSKPRREKAKAGASGAARRRYCHFCQENIDDVDFKDLASLCRVVSDRGKIRSSRVTGTCRRHQVQVAVAVKRAREMALLPNVNS